MTIRESAGAALVRAREGGIPVPSSDPPFRRRLRRRWPATSQPCSRCPLLTFWWVMIRVRSYGGALGLLITVENVDDPDVVLRFIPETGNTGTGGGAYLLLDACPGCSGGSCGVREIPVAAATGLADLGDYQHCLRLNLDPPQCLSSSSMTPPTCPYAPFGHRPASRECGLS
jgi:hypothetical protein